jgi:hypothetical protein
MFTDSFLSSASTAHRVSLQRDANAARALRRLGRRDRQRRRQAAESHRTDTRALVREPLDVTPRELSVSGGR